ncbi:hypothetical protein C8R44DRAFT_698950 [Mycena epipterygia]|nr:hypothetical protein C8R44DRAFT_698950 [Mycena epipterygia]
MAEFALINIDKREVVDPIDGGYGWKVKEGVMNGMPTDTVWLFAVPADNQSEPVPQAKAKLAAPWARNRRPAPASVALGHWAGDRVLLADEYCGTAADYLPAALIAEYPNARPKDDVLEFAKENFTHVSLPAYAHMGAEDALFPTDRVWVLRNLTRGWYVRADVLVVERHRRGPDASGGDGGGMGLGHVLWAEIGGAGSPMSGKWGRGDKFDIQPLATVEDSEDGVQWKDLSEQGKRALSGFDL